MPFRMTQSAREGERERERPLFGVTCNKEPAGGEGQYHDGYDQGIREAVGEDPGVPGGEVETDESGIGLETYTYHKYLLKEMMRWV